MMNLNFINRKFSLQTALRNSFGLVIIFTLSYCNRNVAEEKNHPTKEDPDPKNNISILVSDKVVTQKKKIYITFDDGPNEGTRNVLSIMRQEQAPVSFFLVGVHANGNPKRQALLDSIRNYKYAQLYNHSYSHAARRYERFYANPASVVADFDKAHDLLQLNNTIARCPGRNAWRMNNVHVTGNEKSKAAIDLLYKRGYTLVGWDVEWHYDNKTMKIVQTPEVLVAQIDSLLARKKTKHDGNIILLAHDQLYRSPQDSAALHRFIKILKSRQDYELDIVGNYPGVVKK